ncbi:MAG: protein kinase [Polyangiaceae bacterium]|nr:protein kinase [Polyangiaceae bacterium]
MGLAGSAKGAEARTQDIDGTLPDAADGVGSASSGACPSEEELLQWALGTLRGARRAAIDLHVEQCSLCRSTAAVARPGPAAPLETTIFDGRYRLDEELGAGASSAVHRAFDQRLGIDVALKVFRGGDAAQVAQELLLARKISHENVCRVFDTGTADGVAYLSMEYVEGETLAERFARSRRLGPGPDPDAESILRQIIAGLGAAHAAGVIHRDLKAQNILVAATGRVILTDFGLARMAGVEESRAQLVGTPATWAPEQARGEPATFASDVYSFGVVAYRLLCNKEFKVSDPKALDAVPSRYRRALRRCLVLSPDLRLADAAAVKEAFFPHRSSHSTKGLLVAAALALVGVGYFALRSGPPPTVAAPPATSIAADGPGERVTLPPAPSVPGSAAPTASVISASTHGATPSSRPIASHLPSGLRAKPVASIVPSNPAPTATATMAPPKSTAPAGPDLLYAP